MRVAPSPRTAGFRGLAARILHGWGYEVIEAGTVADAVASVVEHRPRTVLVDIGLPDGDGFGLTRRLVALPSPPRVVLISTDADAGNRSAAHRVGAVGFLPKDELLGGALPGLIDGQEPTATTSHISPAPRTVRRTVARAGWAACASGRTLAVAM